MNGGEAWCNYLDALDAYIPLSLDLTRRRQVLTDAQGGARGGQGVAYLMRTAQTKRDLAADRLLVEMRAVVRELGHQ